MQLYEDRDNCGSCGHTCGAGEVCNVGSCASTCVAGQRLCHAGTFVYCANVVSDNTNCGDCGVACGPESACVNAKCSLQCTTTQALCDTECADLQSDVKHCGSCGKQCYPAQHCIDGACVCPSGQTVCGSACVDLMTDTNDCGACSKTCNGTCAGGRCDAAIAYTQNAVDTLAIDSGRVFWVEAGGALNQIFKTGKTPVALSSNASTTSIAVDTSYVYWPNGAAVDFASIGGGTPSEQSLSVQATEVVTDTQYVYVAHAGGIVRFPSGGGTATNVVTGESSPHALATISGVLYWANDSCELRRANVDGSSLSTLATMTSAIGHVASDGFNVYFTWASDVLAVPTYTWSPPLVLATNVTLVSRVATDGRQRVLERRDGHRQGADRRRRQDRPLRGQRRDGSRRRFVRGLLDVVVGPSHEARAQVTRRALIAVFALACSSSNGPRHYHLSVSPDFSAAQSQAIFDAALQWQTRSGGFVTFDGNPSSWDVVHFDLVTTTQLTSEFGGGTIGLDTQQGRSSHVQIVSGLDDQTFHQTALHELGHAFGLVHMTPGNIMCADTVCATLDVRCGDLEQLTGKKTVSGCIP